VTWLQIELRATADSLAAVEDALQACGALSLTLLSDADEPVLEPAPGATPLWSSVRVQALFDLHTDMAQLRRTLTSAGLLTTPLAVDFVQPEDWQASARNHAVNEVFAERLWVLPKDAAIKPRPGVVELRLEPGLAFGSGSHPTTRLCLRWLAKHLTAGQRVLDFGCGSGILAIAAVLLGARVVAVDHDPQALVATRENAAYNGISGSALSVLSLEAWRQQRPADQFDVVVANILAGPLQTLAEDFEDVLVDGGALVLSGILQTQADEVAASYRATAFAPVEIEAGWVCLHGTRRRR